LRVDAGVVAALAAFGARSADLERAGQLQADGVCHVYPENWPAVEVFLALATQWRVVSLSTLTTARLVQTGLDYTAIEPVMRLFGVKPKRRVATFQKIRAMESAALDVLLPT
jgi:hypothetical protein